MQKTTTQGLLFLVVEVLLFLSFPTLGLAIVALTKLWHEHLEGITKRGKVPRSGVHMIGVEIDRSYME